MANLVLRTFAEEKARAIDEVLAACRAMLREYRRAKIEHLDPTMDDFVKEHLPVLEYAESVGLFNFPKGVQSWP